MSQNENHGAVRRFSGDGAQADATEYRKWKVWAKKYLKSNTSLKAVERGPKLYTLLDGSAQDECLDIGESDELALDGSELLIFTRLDIKFPATEPEDKIAEALDEVWELKMMKEEIKLGTHKRNEEQKFKSCLSGSEKKKLQ